MWRYVKATTVASIRPTSNIAIRVAMSIVKQFASVKRTSFHVDVVEGCVDGGVHDIARSAGQITVVISISMDAET